MLVAGELRNARMVARSRKLIGPGRRLRTRNAVLATRLLLAQHDGDGLRPPEPNGEPALQCLAIGRNVSIQNYRTFRRGRHLLRTTHDVRPYASGRKPVARTDMCRQS